MEPARIGWRDLPELLAFLVGAALRLRLHATFDPSAGFDFRSHYRYIDFVARYHQLPPISAYRTAYHPPLFYWLTAVLVRRGWPPADVQWVSIAFGIAALGLAWLGLRRHLRGDRVGRTFALLLAALLPASLHLCGMITNEPLNVLLSTAALLLLAEVARASGQTGWALGWALGAALGVVLALTLLTKMSGLTIVGVACGLAAAQIVFARGASLRARALAVGPVALAVAIALAVSLPIYARNYRETHKLIPTGFDGREGERKVTATKAEVPYLSRRPLGFLGVGGCPLLAFPWYPTCARSPSRFLPVLYASTFTDYYNFGFFGPPDGDATVRANTKPLSIYAARFMRAAVVAGVPITLATLAALVGCVPWLLRRRDGPRLLLVLTPVAAVLGQLHFAIAFPFDQYGPVKGSYMQYTAAPLCALFGVAAGWCWRRRWWRWTLAVQVLALALLAAGDLAGRRVWLGPGTAAHDVIMRLGWFAR